MPSKCTNFYRVSTDAIVHPPPWVLWPIRVMYETRLRESIQVLAELACEILRMKLADDKSSIQKTDSVVGMAVRTNHDRN